MAKLYRRGKLWYITFYQSGQRVRRSLGREKKQAEDAYGEILYKISRNELVSGQKIPLGLFQKEFLEYVRARQAAKTAHNYTIALNHFVKYLSEKHNVKCLRDVDMAMVDGYVASRLKAPSPSRKGSQVARSTVNTELKGIKRFFNRAVELGFLKESPARRVKLLSTAKKNPRFFSEAEVGLILDTCGDNWVGEIYLTLLYTGMRIGELVNLEWSDVDLIAHRLTVRPKDFWKPKGNEERIIPLHDAVSFMLLNKKRRSNWVFTKADGKKIKIHSLEARFRHHLNRLGIRDANLHTWRHTFASFLVMRTGNIRAVQQLLGHKSIKTTEIYSHLSDKHLHGVVGQLPGPSLGTVLGTPAILPGRAIAQVVDNKVVGDTGFEPVTPTV